MFRRPERGQPMPLRTEAAPPLRVEGLNVRYGPIRAVRDLSLTVGEGEIVALLGANGAGKTSTLEAICGLRTAVEGSVAVDGIEVLGEVPEAIVRRGLALSPEGRRVFPSLTIGENLTVAALGQPAAAVEALRERMLELFPVLRERYGAHASHLSGGEQQQLAIARALMSEPRVLLLDEPSLGLAPKLIAAMFELVQRLRDDGLSILLVEQNLHQTLAICDRAYVLRNGEVEVSGTPAELDALDVEGRYLGVPIGGTA